MTPEEVNGLIAKRAAAFSRLDAAALGALYAENCVVDTPAGGGTVTGRDANENVYRGFFAAFSRYCSSAIFSSFSRWPKR